MPFRWLTIFLDFPAGSFDAGVAFWREVTGSTLSPFRGVGDEFATLRPGEGDAWLRVQRTADGSAGCHLDLHATSLDEARTRAVKLGATERHRGDGLVIAESPGGFTFCLVRWHGESTVPGPVQPGAAGTDQPGAAGTDQPGAAGTDQPGAAAGTADRQDAAASASRADQLCLDIPPAAYDRECAFWAALTGWHLHPGARREFAYLDRPEGLPVRLLLQRRDSAGQGDRVTGHVDFACTDRQRLAARPAAAGARIVSVFPHWITMADPTGRPYCLTARDPLTSRIPAR